MIVLCLILINLILLGFYKSGGDWNRIFMVGTLGWSILLHEICHWVPAKLFGWRPKFIWGGVDGGVAAVDLSNGLYSGKWSAGKDYVVSCATYLLPTALIFAINYVDLFTALYFGWVTVRGYLASHYDEKMHQERVFMSQLYGWD